MGEIELERILSTALISGFIIDDRGLPVNNVKMEALLLSLNINDTLAVLKNLTTDAEGKFKI